MACDPLLQNAIAFQGASLSSKLTMYSVTHLMLIISAGADVSSSGREPRTSTVGSAWNLGTWIARLGPGARSADGGWRSENEQCPLLPPALHHGRTSPISLACRLLKSRRRSERLRRRVYGSGRVAPRDVRVGSGEYDRLLRLHRRLRENLKEGIAHDLPDGGDFTVLVRLLVRGLDPAGMVLSDLRSASGRRDRSPLGRCELQGPSGY